MTNIQNLTSSQLRKVVAIKEQIEQLEGELAALAGGSSAPSAAPATRGPGKIKAGRRKMSASAKARIGAAQRARWAKVRAAAGRSEKVSVTKAKTKGKRRKLSPAVRAKLAAIAKARWAKVKASGKSAL
jgi:hypothetical protein